MTVTSKALAGAAFLVVSFLLALFPQARVVAAPGHADPGWQLGSGFYPKHAQIFAVPPTNKNAQLAFGPIHRSTYDVLGRVANRGWIQVAHLRGVERRGKKKVGYNLEWGYAVSYYQDDAAASAAIDDVTVPLSNDKSLGSQGGTATVRTAKAYVLAAVFGERSITTEVFCAVAGKVNDARRYGKTVSMYCLAQMRALSKKLSASAATPPAPTPLPSPMPTSTATAPAGVSLQALPPTLCAGPGTCLLESNGFHYSGSGATNTWTLDAYGWATSTSRYQASPDCCSNTIDLQFYVQVRKNAPGGHVDKPFDYGPGMFQLIAPNGRQYTADVCRGENNSPLQYGDLYTGESDEGWACITGIRREPGIYTLEWQSYLVDPDLNVPLDPPMARLNISIP